MTPDLFGRPGSYPACQSPGTCNQGRNCDCQPARRVDNDRHWFVCDRFCAVLLVAVVAFVIVIGG